MKLVIPDDYQDVVRRLDCFAMLAGHDVNVTVFHDTLDTDRETDHLAARFAGADALILIRERTRITRALLEKLPRLRLISQTGKGIAHIDLQACTDHGVAVAAGIGSPYAPAELTWALILAAMRHLPQEAAALRAGQWQIAPLGLGLRGRTLGIFGYGKIGSLVATVGRAFGMEVRVWGREGSLERALADGFMMATSQRTLFAASDVLSLHLRLVNETRGIVTRDDLAAMKPTALLVNTSRAELIAPGALFAALREGRPGQAALDVFEREPAADDPLVQLDNVIATPHLGYVEKDSYELYFSAAIEQALAFFAGQPIRLVNPEALGKRG